MDAEFPTSPPLDRPLTELTKWTVVIGCSDHSTSIAVAVLAKAEGAQARLGDTIQRLKCPRCGAKNVDVTLAANAQWPNASAEESQALGAALSLQDGACNGRHG